MSSFGFQWHLTDRCNLRCAHCYQDRFDTSAELLLEDQLTMAHRVLSSFGEGEVTINLTGGEPLTLPWLFDLMDFLEGRPEVGSLALITNGTRSSAPILAAIRRSEKLQTIKVSVESGHPERNDRLRGAGNLRRVSAGVERLLTTGREVVAMVTLSETNVGDVAATIDWARAAGLHGALFERFVPLGRGGEQMGDRVLTPRQWGAACAAIGEAAGLEVDPVDLVEYKAFWLGLGSSEGTLRGATCDLGSEAMALLPDGTVYPCRRLPIPQGNVLREPFGPILERLAGFAAAELRPRLEGERCSRCHVSTCAGCRAMALAVTGKVLGDDPCCVLTVEGTGRGRGDR